MTKIKTLIKNMLTPLTHFFIRIMALWALPSNKKELSPIKIRRILVYTQMGIGNMVMFTPLLKALRSHFQHSKIILIFLHMNGAEQVVKGSSLVDEIIIWDIKKLSYLQKLRLIFQMKDWKPDLIISRFNSHYPIYALITVLSRAPFRIGHVSSGGWKGKYDYLNNYCVIMNEKEHEIDRYLRLASDVGIPIVDQKPFFYINSDDIQTAQTFLRAHGINNDGQFITIQMGTSHMQRWKQWDIKKWVMLTENLLRNNIKIVAVGSPDERGMIVSALSNLTIKPIVAAGKMTLKQTAAIIKKSRLLVCNDSGLMHIAVAMDTLVVAIYGPTDYTRTAPLGDKHVVVRKDLSCSPCYALDGSKKVESCMERICLELIEVEEVLNIVLNRLNGNI